MQSVQMGERAERVQCVRTNDAKFCIQGQFAMSNDEIQTHDKLRVGGNQPASLRLARVLLASVLRAASSVLRHRCESAPNSVAIDRFYSPLDSSSHCEVASLVQRSPHTAHWAEQHSCSSSHAPPPRRRRSRTARNCIAPRAAGQTTPKFHQPHQWHRGAARAGPQHSSMQNPVVQM